MHQTPTKGSHARRLAPVVAALALVNAFTPLVGAVDPSVFSGDRPLDPINIVWARVDGVAAAGNGAPLAAVTLEFLVKNQPKSLTFNGVNAPLGPGDEVRVADFTGQYDVSGGNIKFSGTASSWEVCNRDRDGDGLGDCAERYTHGTDPSDPDTDGDGLNDGAEVLTHRTDPRRADTDGDGLKDGREVLALGTDPRRADTDRDGLTDGAEVLLHGTDPRVGDTDADGLPDRWEVVNGTDPLTPDAFADPDGDGLANAGEFAAGTRPLVADTDADGMPDGYEVAHGLAPVVDDAAGDLDGDLLANLDEFRRGTRPDVADTDGGGIDDGTEVSHETDPLDPVDDFVTIVWTEDAPRGARGFAIDATWLQIDGDFRPDGTYAGALGTVAFDAVGDQWMSLNGTDVAVKDGYLVKLEGFRGMVVKSTVDGVDRVSVDGHATLVYITPLESGTVVHTYGRVATHGDTVSVDVFEEVAGTELVSHRHEELTLPTGSPVPAYLLFDFYKFEHQLTTFGTYQISITPGTYQGEDVTWVQIFNADPNTIVVPLPTATPAGGRVCAPIPGTPTPC